MKKVLLGLLAVSALSFAASETRSIPVQTRASIESATSFQITNATGVAMSQIFLDHGVLTTGRVTNSVAPFEYKIVKTGALDIKTGDKLTLRLDQVVSNMKLLGGSEELKDTLTIAARTSGISTDITPFGYSIVAAADVEESNEVHIGEIKSTIIGSDMTGKPIGSYSNQSLPAYFTVTYTPAPAL